MGILDELSSATGDKHSNLELAKRCLLTPALLHSVAEGLRTGTPKARVDCALILLEVAKRRPDTAGPFVGDFLEASRDLKKKGGSKRVAKLGFSGLALVAPARPADVFAQRDYLLGACQAGGPMGIEAAKVLAVLCQSNANYRGKLLRGLLRLLGSLDGAELLKWLTAIGPAVQGSGDGLKRLQQTIAGQLEGLGPTERKKADKLLIKLERSTIGKTRR